MVVWFIPMIVAMLGGALLGNAVAPVLTPVRHAMYGFMPTEIPAPAMLAELRWRRKISEVQYMSLMRANGFADDHAKNMYWSVERVMDVTIAIRAKRYGFIDESEYKTVMLKNHVPEDQLEIFERGQMYIPPPADIIRMAAREVFEPRLRERFRIDEGMPTEFAEYGKRIGMDETTTKNYWASHWALPSGTNIMDMWHRDIISETDVDEFFVELDMVPFWRENLKKVSWDLPTRREIRMMMRERTLDRDGCKDVLIKRGVDPKYASDLADFMVAYAIRTDLKTRYSYGYLNSDDVRNELLAAGLSPDRAQRVFETIVKAEQPARTAKERDLTKAEIVKGVKKDIIDMGQGIELLMRMGYDNWEANYILMINIAALAGSPDTYAEYREIVETYRKSRGLESVEIPPELKAIELEMIQKKKEIKEARERKAPEADIMPLEGDLAEIEARYRKLALALRKA